MNREFACHPRDFERRFEERFEKRFERRFGRCGQRHDGLRCGLFFGGALVVAGVLFLLQHLGMLGGYTAWQFWPLLLVVAGISNLVRRRTIGGFVWGGLLIGGGGLALAHSLSLVALPWGVIWPIGLVLLGLSLIVGLFVLIGWHRRWLRRQNRDQG
jgi:hypothetical protein